jgi:hypothetical protein
VYRSIKDESDQECLECKESPARRLLSAGGGFIMTGKEVWEYSDVHYHKPKYLRSRDGKHRVKYDPNKHGHSGANP